MEQLVCDPDHFQCRSPSRLNQIQSAAVLSENLMNYAKSLDLDYALVKVGVSPFNLVGRCVA